MLSKQSIPKMITHTLIIETEVEYFFQTVTLDSIN